jgi:hypothetical protein
LDVIIIVQVVWGGGGPDGCLWHSFLHVPWRGHFAFYRDSEFSLRKE